MTAIRKLCSWTQSATNTKHFTLVNPGRNKPHSQGRVWFISFCNCNIFYLHTIVVKECDYHERYFNPHGQSFWIDFCRKFAYKVSGNKSRKTLFKEGREIIMWLLIKEFTGAACGVGIVLVLYYAWEFIKYLLGF